MFSGEDQTNQNLKPLTANSKLREGHINLETTSAGGMRSCSALSSNPIFYFPTSLKEIIQLNLEAEKYQDDCSPKKIKL